MAWPVTHRLESVVLTVHLPSDDHPGVTSITAVGRASTKRGNLWAYSENFDDYEDVLKGYGPADALHHILLVCQQDHPNTLERLNFALRGGVSWEQQELW